MNPLLRPSRTCSAEATAIQFLLMACPGKKAHAIAIKIATQRYSRNPISAQFLEAIARRAQPTDRQCQEASFVPRDRKFESISLQRGVSCEPHFRWRIISQPEHERVEAPDCRAARSAVDLRSGEETSTRDAGGCHARRGSGRNPQDGTAQRGRRASINATKWGIAAPARHPGYS